MIIFVISVCGQFLIVECGRAAFQTTPLTLNHWMMCITIGALSIPVGAFIRMIPDDMFFVKRRLLKDHGCFKSEENNTDALTRTDQERPKQDKSVQEEVTLYASGYTAIAWSMYN